VLSQFVLFPVSLWWGFTGLAMWAASHKGRLWVWMMSGLGFCLLAALAATIHVQTAEPDAFFAFLDSVILWLTLPIAACGQGLLTWWILGRPQ